MKKGRCHPMPFLWKKDHMRKLSTILYTLWFTLFLKRKETKVHAMLHPERLHDLKEILRNHFQSSNAPFLLPFASTIYWESLDYLQNNGWHIQVEAIDDDLYYVISAATYKSGRVKI